MGARAASRVGPALDNLRGGPSRARGA
jgi:hypothetical protein